MISASNSVGTSKSCESTRCRSVVASPRSVFCRRSTGKMPSSQLSQLKSALNSTGLGRKSYSKKEKKAFKKGGGREADKAKTLARLEEIRKGLNKFDVRETKVRLADAS